MDDDAPQLNVQVVEHEAELARRAADVVSEVVALKPDATLVLPTGRTPLGLYAELVCRVRDQFLDLRRVRILPLDEYAHLPPGDPRLLGDWLDRVLVTPAGLTTEQVVQFRSDATDEAAECAKLDSAVRKWAIDLLVLGLGPNGHLGFNEPGSRVDSPTRVVALSAASIASNAGYWPGEASVPRFAYTLGLGTLRAARRTLLLVSGPHKAGILARLVSGPIGPDNPSTIIRTMQNVTVIVDRQAASQLAAKV